MTITSVFLIIPECETVTVADKIAAYIHSLEKHGFYVANYPSFALLPGKALEEALGIGQKPRVSKWLRCISFAECVARVPGWEDNPESQLWDYIARYLNIPEVHLENGQPIIEAEATRPTEYGEA